MTLTDGPPIPVPTREEYETFLKRIEQMATAGQSDAGRSMVNYGSILYLTQERMGKAQPVSDQAKSDEHPPARTLKPSTPPGGVKLPAVLFLAGLASMGVSAGYPHRSEVRPMAAILPRPAASTSMLAGAAAQLRGDYREALGHYQEAGTKSADAECYLPPMIEIYINTQQFGLAGLMLAKLANANPRDESLVPYYRAAILYGSGNTKSARGYYAEAEKLGHPGAAQVLDFIGRL